MAEESAVSFVVYGNWLGALRVQAAIRKAFEVWSGPSGARLDRDGLKGLPGRSILPSK